MWFAWVLILLCLGFFVQQCSVRSYNMHFLTTSRATFNFSRAYILFPLPLPLPPLFPFLPILPPPRLLPSIPTTSLLLKLNVAPLILPTPGPPSKVPPTPLLRLSPSPLSSSSPLSPPPSSLSPSASPSAYFPVYVY